MRQTNQNSIAIYHMMVKPHLTKMQDFVLKAYEDGKAYTDHEIANDVLHVGINRVSGRVGELLGLGLLEEISPRASKYSHIASRCCRKKYAVFQSELF